MLGTAVLAPPTLASAHGPVGNCFDILQRIRAENRDPRPLMPNQDLRLPLQPWSVMGLGGSLGKTEGSSYGEAPFVFPAPPGRFHSIANNAVAGLIQGPGISERWLSNRNGHSVWGNDE